MLSIAATALPFSTASGTFPTLDEMVEVTFTASPRVRRIVAHDPHSLSFVDYLRQIFWASGVDLPEDKETFERLIAETTLEAIELPPGDKAVLSLQLPAHFIIVFDPVTHAAHFIDVKGETTRDRQNLVIVLNKLRAPTGKVELRPGPLRLHIENRTDLRTLPGVWIAGDALHELLGQRKPFLTAKRLLTNQTFRDIYGAETLNVTQRLKITCGAQNRGTCCSVGWVVDKSCDLHSPCDGVRSEGAGVSRSDLGYFGCLQVESAADCRESLLTAAVIGAAVQIPSPAPPQRRPALLDLREPVVRQLAHFTPYCEARDRVTVASTGLASLLVLAITARATECRSPSHSSVTSGSHPADDD